MVDFEKEYNEIREQYNHLYEKHMQLKEAYSSMLEAHACVHDKYTNLQREHLDYVENKSIVVGDNYTLKKR